MVREGTCRQLCCVLCFPASRSLSCECDCNTPEQGRSGVPCHRYDRSPLEPRTQQFRLRYPVLYRNSFLESYVANLGTRSVSAVVFLLSKKAHPFEVIEKLLRSFSENVSANSSVILIKLDSFITKIQQ